MTETDKTNPADAGATTSEHFWTKVIVILASVGSAAGFATEVVTRVTGFFPEGSAIARWAMVAGAVVALVKTITYEISRTIVKLKLADMEVEIANAPTRPAPTTPGEAANTVLGSDAPSP